ncbi:MAG: hypothetical protein AAGK32_20295 [Actinomycetota bacterium]
MPATAVMTDRFVSAAELMTATLGAPDHPFVTIPHPLSSAEPDALVAAAREAAASCVDLLIDPVQLRAVDP